MMPPFLKHNRTFFALLACATFLLTSCNKDDEPAQPQPTLTSLNITEGEVGTSVTLTGRNFGTSTNDVKVFFNTTEAIVSSLTTTQVVTTVPSGITPGEVDVKVSVKTLETASQKFTVLAPITVSATDFTTSITENPGANAILGTVQATTNRGALVYSLTSQSVSGAFAINSSNGQLTVADESAFDYEVNTSLTATISVANGTETATANVTIMITDAVEVGNIQNFTTSIAENPGANAGIGQVSASILNSNEKTFAIVSQTPAGAVSIDASTGLIQVASPSLFDHENNPTITGVVSVTSRSETKTATFTITVTDVSEAPSVTVSAVAGDANLGGCYDGGTLEHIYFTRPFFGTLQNNNGTPTIYLADLTCGIKKVTLGATTTLSSEYFPADVAAEQFSDVHPYSNYLLATRKVSSPGKADSHQIVKIENDGRNINVTALVAGSPLVYPVGITVGGNGNIYVADQSGRRIRVYDNNGSSIAVIGNGNVGGTDGDEVTATFALVRDVQVDANGVMYIADRYSIRKYDPSTGLVNTLAGTNASGDAVGSASQARFNEIHAIGLMPNGDILIADHLNTKIKVLRTNGTVETLLDNLNAYPEGIMIQDNNTFYFTLQNRYALYKAVISN
ncbi:hypothetical protein SanaruYs_28250 [Chryseotalea sanaruensis]|uniref:Cadherin domain-containing protein n=1 Tax=Chryseotalea sanaruensis TaxID=2482724 RepID=A0A401UCG8_9BACT|nr:IPT/TIG domain-containing protein [Chryseotalea sanaruensis]GCC52588.1 hypothetical protein SanaruYs_28250 [Chryseotalea sanaruensis]